jgi:hypothetical protein
MATQDTKYSADDKPWPSNLSYTITYGWNISMPARLRLLLFDQSHQALLGRPRVPSLRPVLRRRWETSGVKKRRDWGILNPGVSYVVS